MQRRLFKKKFKNNKITVANKFLGSLNLGIFGLKAVNSGVLTQKQLETVRRIVTRNTKRLSKIIIRVFFYQPCTQKGLSSRMGKGSGSIKLWIAYIKKGMVLLELSNVNQIKAQKILQKAYNKLPFKTVFVTRNIISSQN